MKYLLPILLIIMMFSFSCLFIKMGNTYSKMSKTLEGRIATMPPPMTQEEFKSIMELQEKYSVPQTYYWSNN